MEIPSTIINNEPLSRVIEEILKKAGDKVMPELVPGSSRGTILEYDIDVSIVKNNPTRRNWYLFLTKKGFMKVGDRLLNIENNDWMIRYALARSFTGKNVVYDLNVTADMFDRESFLCFPEAMEHIVESGVIDCTVNWSQTDYLNIWATLDYREHYPKKNADGVSVFFWYGQIDRNGILRSKLELRKDDKHTY